MAECQCGCGEQVTAEGWFRPGHDQTVLAALSWIYGSVAILARAYGFGPGGRNAMAIVTEAKQAS